MKFNMKSLLHSIGLAAVTLALAASQAQAGCDLGRYEIRRIDMRLDTNDSRSLKLKILPCTGPDFAPHSYQKSTDISDYYVFLLAEIPNSILGIAPADASTIFYRNSQDQWIALSGPISGALPPTRKMPEDAYRAGPNYEPYGHLVIFEGINPRPLQGVLFFYGIGLGTTAEEAWNWMIQTRHWEHDSLALSPFGAAPQGGAQ